MNLQTATPVEFDTEYARLSNLHMTAVTHRSMAIDSLHGYVGDDGKSFYIGRKRHIRFELNAAETLAKATAGEFTPAYNISAGERTLARYNDAAEKARELSEQMSEMDAAYRARGGWSRFFIVSGGHIHSSMSCSTCNKNGQPTSFGWLPGLSGLTEAAAVEAHGAILCTVCFPSAPVEWTNGYELEAAKKAAEKCGGTYDGREAKANGYRKYQKCTTCGTLQLTTNSGLRAHKAK